MCNATKIDCDKLTFRSSLQTVRLHSDVRIEMVQSAVRLLAALKAALVHALDFFVPAAGALVLLRPGDGYERIHLLNRVSIRRQKIKNYGTSRN